MTPYSEVIVRRDRSCRRSPAFELPLAAWRVHATAADLEPGSGNLKAARLHRDLSRATILRLANSLPEEEPLRKIFLSAPAVVGVLSKDA